jgi:hypothetical protein
MKEPTCSICQQPFSMTNCFNPYTVKYGNNAQPVNDGKCCDECNRDIVIPARIVIVQAEIQAKRALEQ